MKKFNLQLLKIIVSGFLLLGVGFLFSFFLFNSMHKNFQDLSPAQMHERIIQERAQAIELAKARGDYHCCINPPCTMCYDNPNKWNHNQAGKCFCDEFIARGEDPCPQCQKDADSCISSPIKNPDDNF